VAGLSARWASGVDKPRINSWLIHRLPIARDGWWRAGQRQRHRCPSRPGGGDPLIIGIWKSAIEIRLETQGAGSARTRSRPPAGCSEGTECRAGMPGPIRTSQRFARRSFARCICCASLVKTHDDHLTHFSSMRCRCVRRRRFVISPPYIYGCCVGPETFFTKLCTFCAGHKQSFDAEALNSAAWRSRALSMTSQSFHLNQSLPGFGADPRRQMPWSGRIGWPRHSLLLQWLSVNCT
jgi:hypothetical protein